MPLVPLSRVRRLLACPQCGSRLIGPLDRLSCDGETGPHEFTSVGNPPIPILIDSDASIVDVISLRERGATSAVVREHVGVQGWVRRVSTVRNATVELYSSRLVDDVVDETTGRPLVLVVGGGAIGKGLAAMYEDHRIDLVAFDIYSSANVQLVADAHQIPFRDATVDGVVIQAVLEHVLEPHRVVNEIYRVLRREGLVLSETPFMQQVHEGAYDFARFTDSGHRYLFRNFVRRASGASSGLGTQLLWSIDYFARGLTRQRLAGRLIRLVCFWLPYLDSYLDAETSIDGASTVFFYGHSASDSVRASDIVAYYAGRQHQ